MISHIPKCIFLRGNAIQVWHNTMSNQCLHWKYFTFATHFSIQTCSIMKKHLKFEKNDYVNGKLHTNREIFWFNDVLSRMSRKCWNFDCDWVWQFTFFNGNQASCVHEGTTLVNLVSYKHNVAAKHMNLKQFTINQLQRYIFFRQC